MREALNTSLAGALQKGLRRVAIVADGAANHDYVLGNVVPWEEYGPIIDPDSGRIPASNAYELFRTHVATAKCRSYELPSDGSETVVLSYAYTLNNQRELAFLRRLVHDLGLQFEVYNVCDAEPRYRVGVDERLNPVLAEAVKEFLVDRPDVAPGLLHHLCKFATSAQGAYDTLSGTAYRTFAVANDHSPAPVAFATIARFLGHRIMYLQHAEVTSIFPPLDFDLSVLRNQRSARVYESIAPPRGDLIVAARGEERWRSPQESTEKQGELAQQPTAPVVVYPSSVVETSQLTTLLGALTKNPNVTTVAVKLHPNARNKLPELVETGIQMLQETPAQPHVAVCGNSSIAIELLEQGCVVFQDFTLDRVARDYYHFVADGLTHELPAGYGVDRFWNLFTPLDGTRSELLADYLPRLDTPKNREAAREVGPALLRFLVPPKAVGRSANSGWIRAIWGRLVKRPPHDAG